MSSKKPPPDNSSSSKESYGDFFILLALFLSASAITRGCMIYAFSCYEVKQPCYSWREEYVLKTEADVEAPYFEYMRGERQNMPQALCEVIDEFIPLEYLDEGKLFRCGEVAQEDCEGKACLSIALPKLYDNLDAIKTNYFAGKDARYDIDVKEGEGCAVDFYTKCFAVRFHPKYKVRDYWNPDQFNAFSIVHYKLQLTDLKRKLLDKCKADACVLAEVQKLGAQGEAEQMQPYVINFWRDKECDSFACFTLIIRDDSPSEIAFFGEIAVTGRIEDEDGSGEYLDCAAIFCSNLHVEGFENTKDGDYAVEISNRF